MRSILGTRMARLVAVSTLLATTAVVSGVVTDVPTVGAATATVGTEADFKTAYADNTMTEITLSADITFVDCGSGPPTRAALSPVVTIIGNGHTITQTCVQPGLYDSGLGTTLVQVTVNGGTGGVLCAGSVIMRNSRVTGATEIGVQALGFTMIDSEVDHITSPTQAAGVVFGGDAKILRSSIHDVVAVQTSAGLIRSLLGPQTVTMESSSISHIVGTGSPSQAFAVYFTTGALAVTDSSVTDVSGTVAGGLVGLDLTISRSTVARIEGSTSGSAGIAMSESVSATNVTIANVGDRPVDPTSIDPTASAPLTFGPNARSLGYAIGGSAQMTLVYMTVTNTPGIFGPDGSTITIFGSVIAQSGPTNPNCTAPSIVSAGYNFADDTSCTLTGTGDRQGVGLDPMLAALAANGGVGQTRLPLTGSPLLDAIPVDACQSGPAAGVTTDERGVTRPQGTGCDIGAVEVEVPIPVVPTFTG